MIGAAARMRLLGRRWIYAAVAVLAAGVVLALLLRPAGDTSDGQPALERPSDSLLASAVEIWRYGSDGRRQWELVADSVAVGEDTVYKGIREGKLYTDDGYLTFQADEVTHDEKTGNLEIVGNVVVSDEKGASLHTSRIFYTADDATVTCPEPVTLESADSRIHGDSMVGNTETGELEIIGSVKAFIGSGGILTAERVRYNTKDGSMSVEKLQFSDL